MTSVFFDTYAWVEYLEGSEEGEAARRYLEDEECQVYTSILTVAELSDVFQRGGLRTKLEWTRIENFMLLNSTLVALDAREMAEAGALKAQRKRQFKDFGLIDAIILRSSRKVGAKLLTNDPHLLSESDAMPLRQPPSPSEK